jgi:hypothetical protein
MERGRTFDVHREVQPAESIFAQVEVFQVHISCSRNQRKLSLSLDAKPVLPYLARRQQRAGRD